MTRRLRELLLTATLVVVASAAVSASRASLFASHKGVKEKHDVYFLPPPKHVAVMSLGYKSAIADVLWAHVMVSQGLHTFERRRFENLLLLYDAINELDPTWRTPYLLADALITFQSNATPIEEVVRAREILERGARHRPYDAEIWLNLGQFVSFVAPASYLESKPVLAEQWRIDGVAFLARAAELGGDNSNISWQALGGANILARAGKQEANIRFLQRTYAVTDDEELKEDIMRRLRRDMADRDFAVYRDRGKRFEALFRGELPFIRLNRALLFGPPPTPERCAGRGHEREPACATHWRAWSERYDRTK
jgi:hypothetical protein